MTERFIVAITLTAFVVTMGCALSTEQFGWKRMDIAIGSAIAGDNCENEDGAIECDDMVWSEGFSEGLMGTIGSVVKGIVGFFVPSAREPQPIYVNVSPPEPEE